MYRKKRLAIAIAITSRIVHITTPKITEKLYKLHNIAKTLKYTVYWHMYPQHSRCTSFGKLNHHRTYLGTLHLGGRTDRQN